MEILSEGDAMTTLQIWDEIFDNYKGLRRHIPILSTFAVILDRTPQIEKLGLVPDWIQGRIHGTAYCDKHYITLWCLKSV